MLQRLEIGSKLWSLTEVASVCSLDVSAMLRLDCTNVSFNVANRQVTIAIGCLHVVHRDDPHAVRSGAVRCFWEALLHDKGVDVP